MTRFTRRIAAVAAALLLIGLATTVVLAQDELLGGKLRTGDTVTVGSGETVAGDLYLLAGTVTMDGTVDGDLLALGGTVTVSGSVTGDVLIAGGTLSLAGTVDGDVRIAGGQVTLAADIAEDAVATGGQVTLASGGSVGGDLITSGGQISVAGTVAGSIEAGAGTYDRTGPAPGGTENVVVSPREGQPAAASVVADTVLGGLRHFVAVLLIGALFLWLVPRLLRSAGAEVRDRPLRSLGWGLLSCIGYIVLVIAIVLVMILLAIVFGLLQLGALVGIDIITGILSLSVVTFLFVVAIAFVADVVVGMTIGRLVAPSDAPGRWLELGLLAAGLAVIVILTSLPVVGVLVKLAVILFGLGALVWAAWHAWRGRNGSSGEPLAEIAPAATPAAPPEAIA